MAASHPLQTFEHLDRLANMRMSLILLALCALACCGKPAPHQTRETEQQKITRQYEAWAARQPRPPAQIVDHIEALLAKQPCIGSVNRWSRYYGYDRLPEKTVDTDIVDFHLEEAGTADVKLGRHITEPDSWVNIDDRPIKMVSGDYDLKDDRIRVGFCGNNVGGKQADLDKMRRYWAELDRRRAAHGTISH